MKRPMDLKWLLLGLAALAFVAYSIFEATHSSFNFGILMVYVITAVLVLLTLFYRSLGPFFASGVGRVVLILAGVGAALLGAVLVFLCLSARWALPTGSEKALVVLGAGLRGDRPSKLLCRRLDAAYAYYQQHPEVLIVTTGGQGLGEVIPEGLAMKRYLVELGVPEEQVLSEEKSTSTEENFLFAKELLAQRGIEAQDPILVVTNAFHCYRGRRYAQMAGYQNVTALPASTPLTALLPCYLREAAALCYYWLFRSGRSGLLSPLSGLLSLHKRFFYH